MRVVDADAHINENPLEWTELNEARPGWLSAGKSGGHWVAEIEGKLYPYQEGPGCGVPIQTATAPACLAGAGDLDVRMSDLDAEGIDVQVLYGGLAIGVGSFADAGFAADFARAYNDWLLQKVCGHSPERLKGVAIVPIQDVARTVAEIERVTTLGAVAITIPPVVGDRNLDDPSLLPVFQTAAKHNLAVGIHSAPGMNVPLPAAGRFSNYLQVHCLSFPIDQMVAFTALAMGGVFDKVPALRVAFLESGIGWVPYFVHRVHEHREKRAEMVPAMKNDPKEYIARGQAYFSFEAEEPMLDVYVEHLGADSIVYASDYPHWDCDFPGTVDEVKERGKNLGDDTLAKILGTNAERLYALAP